MLRRPALSSRFSGAGRLGSFCCTIPCLEPGRHWGNTRAVAELVGLRLAETVHAARRSVPSHRHQQPYITVVLAGTWLQTYGDGSLLCRPRTVVYHPRDEVHADTFGSEPCRCLHIDLGDTWEERLPHPQEPVHISGGPAFRIGQRLHRYLVHRSASSPLAVEGLVLQLLAHLGRAHGSGAPRDRRA